MELVINISEDMHEWINNPNRDDEYYGISDFMEVVKNGIPLPKGHGRLIDADAYKKNLKWNENVDNAPTILEATEEQE